MERGVWLDGTTNHRKGYNHLESEGIVRFTVNFPPSRRFPEGSKTIEDFRITFQRVAASSRYSYIGNNNDLSWDYLDPQTKALIIAEIKSDKETGSILIPGPEGEEGTRIAWMLRLAKKII